MDWQNIKRSGSLSDSAIFSDTDIGNIFGSGSCESSHLPQPYMEILVQPQSKFRFRYKSEMTGKHGSLLGNCAQSEGTLASNCPSPNSSKMYPTVKLHNFPGDAIIRCSLACESAPYYPHPHVLHMFQMVGANLGQQQHHHLPVVPSDCSEKSYTEIDVSNENEHTATFQGMNIIYTGKKGIKKELIHKSSQLQIGDLRKIRPDQIDELSMGINLNVVSLYFEAFFWRPDCSLQSICCPVVSSPIQHNKSTQTSDLRIVRIDKYTSCCTGDEEVFLLVEKVDKHNIQVKIFQENEKGIEIWKAYGKFSKLDVHHQYAIVFKTPPYRSFDIDTEEDVYIQLERPSDGATSPPIPFRYKPIERIRKMPKRQKSRSGSDSQGPSSRSFPPNRDPDMNQNQSSIPEGEGAEDGNNDGNVGIEGNGSCKDSVRQGTEQKFPCDLSSIVLSEDKRANKTLALSVALSVGESLHSWAETSDFSFVLQKLRHLLCLANENGDNALHTAILNQQREPFLRILNTVSASDDVANVINEPNLQNLTPLSVAVLTNVEEFVKELLIHNADMTISNPNGDNPIHLAVKSNHMDCLKSLLQNPKSSQVINSYNYSSMTPLHLAVLENNLKAISLLISANASLLTQEGTYGRTPLHIAVEKGSFSSTFLLLKCGGVPELVNIQNYRGDTSLHCAVGAQLAPICALLLYFGADATIENYNQKYSEDETNEDTPGHTVFDETTNDEITAILNGTTEEWENILKPFINILDYRLDLEKVPSHENIPLDSGIDIKEVI